MEEVEQVVKNRGKVIDLSGIVRGIDSFTIYKPCIKLSTIPYISKCFGIAPIIVQPDGEIDMNLFTMYRDLSVYVKKYTNINDTTFTSSAFTRISEYKYLPSKAKKEVDPKQNKYQVAVAPQLDYHRKTDQEKRDIIENAFPRNELADRCTKAVLDNATHIDIDISLNEFRTLPDEDIADFLMTQGMRLYMMNGMNNNISIYVSNEELYKYLHLEVIPNAKRHTISIPLVRRLSYLDPNIIIIHNMGNMTYDNGLLLCPILNFIDIKKWTVEKQIPDWRPTIHFRKFPICGRHYFWFKLLEQYMKYGHMPERWHIEPFEHASDFIAVLRFQGQ